MQGVTGAILPLCIGLVHENLGQERAPMGIGLMISGASIGTAAGLVVGGMIVDSFNWHGIFFTSAGLCLCAVAATRAFVPASHLRKAPAPGDGVSVLAFAPVVSLIPAFFSMSSEERRVGQACVMK